MSFPNEYEEIRHVRIMWNRGIMIRDYIFIPLMLAIIALTVSQYPNFLKINSELAFNFLIVEGIALSIAALYWRKLAHYTDRQIVGLYGRLLELEKKYGMEIHTRYYYSNLAKKSKKDLLEELCLQENHGGLLRTITPKFEEFKKKAEERSQDYYELLIKQWRKHESQSVSSRGHWIHDTFATAIVALFWIFISGRYWGLWNYLGLVV